MKKSSPPGIIIITICFFIGSIVLMFWENAKLHEEYTPLKSEHAINGVITDVKNRKNMSFIQVDTLKISFVDAWNYDYYPESIQKYLYKGNLFSKSAGNDTIKITQNKRELIFVREKEINE